MVKSIHVKVSDEMYSKLERLRKEKGKLSIPEVVRDAISEYIKKELKEVLING